MLPGSLSLVGSGFRLPTHMFLGCFGPCGPASILYVQMAVEVEAIASREDIFAIVVVTVLLSVFANGFSAVPGARWHSHHSERRIASDPHSAEGRMVDEMPVRLPFCGGQRPTAT